MRFRRWPRVSPYEDTPRKRAALARTQRNQRERLPLFRDLIAEQQSSADAEMARRAEWWPRIQQEGAIVVHRTGVAPGAGSLATAKICAGSSIGSGATARTRPIPAICSICSTARCRLHRSGAAALEASDSAPSTDDARSRQLRRGLPTHRPAQGGRRTEHDRGRRIHLRRQSRERHSLPHLARAAHRSARKLLHLVQSSIARLPCRPQRALGRHPGPRPLLGRRARTDRASRPGR